MTREASCIVRSTIFTLVLTTILINSAFAATTDASAPALSTDEQSALAAYGNLPLTFVENRGQIDPRIRYYGQHGDFGVYFGKDRIVFSLAKPSPSRNNTPAADSRSKSRLIRAAVKTTPEPTNTTLLGLKFLNANPRVVLAAVGPAPGTVNYFRGNDSGKWHTELPQYAEVIYRELWPSVDLRLREQAKALKYEFRVRPGAKVSNIRLAYAGASALRIDNDGAIAAETPAGLLRDVAPVAYQEIAGQRIEVESHYRLNDATGEYGFTVGYYQPDHELIIDPGVGYSTFLGGTADEQGNGIAVDGAGNTYITGITQSPDFTTTAGAFDRTGAVNTVPDAFIAKLNAAGSALVYATFIGGAKFEVGRAIAIDATGNAYVAGQTTSSDFPTTRNAFDRTLNTPGNCPRCGVDNWDAFVTKINASGSALVYSTYLGGGQDIDDALGIAVDSAGNAYVTGEAASPDFPTTPGAFRTVNRGNNDAYVTKLNPTGSALVYSTFLGGTQVDFGVRIRVDAANNAYVIGNTSSPDFPTTPGAFDTTANGGFDVFVTKLNATGSSVLYSTLLGGTGSDDAGSIAVDSGGNAYAVGGTSSADFPTTPGAFQTTPPSANGGGFVTKLNPTGSALVYSTFLGDSGCSGVAITSAGNAWITGGTTSDNFPVTPDAFQRFHHPSSSTPADAIITELNAAGSALLYSTYLGGSDTDFGNDIGLDSAGNAYVTGITRSADFPTTAGAFDRVFKGRQDIFWGDAFITKLALNGAAPPPTASNVAVLQPSLLEVVGGNSFASTVSLSSGAQAPGATVALASSNPSLISVPGSITIPTDAQSGTFTSTTAPVNTNTPVTITASFNSTSKSATVTLTPPPGPAALSSLGFFPNSVTGGDPTTGIIGLTNPAPAGGFIVNLTSNNAAASPPPSVTVPAGEQTFSFSVPTSPVTTSTALSVFATAGGRQAIGTLTVNPPAPPPPSTVTLTVSASGRSGERVTSSPAGINVPVGSSMQTSFNQGTAITLTVSNGRSAIWSGACSSGGNKTAACTFTLNAANSVTANVQ